MHVCPHRHLHSSQAFPPGDFVPVWRPVDLQCRFVCPRLLVVASPEFAWDIRGCLLSDANSGDGREPCHVRGRDRGEGVKEE